LSTKPTISWPVLAARLDDRERSCRGVRNAVTWLEQHNASKYLLREVRIYPNVVKMRRRTLCCTPG
jgi:hypothetical protein